MRWRPKVWHASLDCSRGQPRFFSYSEQTVRTKSTSASRRTRGPGLVSSRLRGLHVGTYGSARWGKVRMARRWRELDSNHQSPAIETMVFARTLRPDAFRERDQAPGARPTTA